MFIHHNLASSYIQVDKFALLDEYYKEHLKSTVLAGQMAADNVAQNLACVKDGK